MTGDHGSRAKLGPLELRVVGLGPRIGYLFPIAGMQRYVNLKGCGEFDGARRPTGWNAWLTFSVSLMAPATAKI